MSRQADAPATPGLDRLWYDDGAGARVLRMTLRPLSALYGAIVGARGALYDRGILRSHELGLPAVSVGNLTVGGTGKTPVSAWIAGLLAERGARPAIVLRGYGDDEPLVHRVLTPEAIVITNPDRVAGVAEAARQGATVAVLDDAFQHRRARRLLDIVLVSAERFGSRHQLLPAGPYREPLRSLRRATLCIVTRKSATVEKAERVASALRSASPGMRTMVVHLAAAGLRSDAEEQPLSALRGAHVLCIAAIGDPDSFVRQLRAKGALVDGAFFRDHHQFSRADVDALADRARAADRVVCTLKDAVKLAEHWPRAFPTLWYVSQRVDPETGGEALLPLLGQLLAGRASDSPTAGQRRPQ